MPRKPQQQRSRATVEAIIESGFRSVASHGVNVSTRQIAETAGISIGSLYEYFANKEEIYSAMHQRFISDVVDLIQSKIPAIVQMEIDEGARFLLKSFSDLLMQNNQRYLVVAREVVHPNSLNFAEPVRQLLMQLVTTFIMSKPHLAALPDTKVMAYIIINSSIFMILHHLTSPNPPITFNQLCDGLAGIIKRHIESAVPLSSK